MRKNKNSKLSLVVILLLMVISVGFAYLTTTLNINGSTLIRGNSWDVHFENITITDGSVTATSEPEIES